MNKVCEYDGYTIPKPTLKKDSPETKRKYNEAVKKLDQIVNRQLNESNRERK